MTEALPAGGAMIVAAIALAALAWLELRRPDRRRLAGRLCASAVAVAALAALAIAPSRTVTRSGSTIVLATEGATAELTDSAAKSAGARIVRLGDSIPDAGALRRRIPAATRVVVAGWGLDEGNLTRLRGIAIEHRPAPLPDGIRELDFPAHIALGEVLEIRGTATSGAGLIRLEDATGLVDSAGSDSAGAFVLRHRPRAAGVARYVVRGERARAETLGVEVRSRRAPGVLILEAMPGFETSRLRDWIARRGGTVAIRSTISRQRTRVEQVNRSGPFGRISPELLAGFDLVVTDGAALSALSAGERQAIERAVRETGLGLLARGDRGLAERRAGMLAEFALAPAGAPEERRSRVRWDGAGGASATGMTLPPRALREGGGVATMMRDASGRPVAQWRPVGIGRAGVSLVESPSRWLLEGEPSAFDGYWGLLVSRLARPRPEWSVEKATPAFVDEPLVIARSGEIAEHAVIEQPDGSRDTVYLAASADSTWWAGSWRPRLAGRHLVMGTDTAAFDVRGATAWPALRAARRSAATSRAALASGRATRESPPPIADTEPISPVPFVLAFVAAAGWLWWERRAGGAAARG